MSRFTTLVSDIETTMAEPTVEYVVGNDKRRRRGSRRRIHWYRVGGPIVVAHRAGATQVGGDTQDNRVRTSWMRMETIECQIHGADDDDAADMLDSLIAAIHNTVPDGGFMFETYEWDDDQINQRGPFVVLRWMVKYPVNDEAKPLTIIEETEETCQIETPIP